MTRDIRLHALEQWVTSIRPEASTPFAPASADASFRCYFRVAAADGTLIAMDAPPEQERSEAFIHVADLLAKAGLHAPEILASDPEQGFLLLSDLGQRTYLEAIERDDADPRPLYADAIDALVRWQMATRSDALPNYDHSLLALELDLFPNWYVRHHLGFVPDDAWWSDWEATVQVLIDAAQAQTRVFVHRDFIPRNLMVSDPNPGIVDFQDAVVGPLTYDLVSLLRDAFISWPPVRENEWIAAWYRQAGQAGLSVPPTLDELQRDFDLMAAQRHLKVLGIFARLRYRDDKPHYLDDAFRFLHYLDRESRPWPELAPLRRLLDRLPEPR